MEAAERGDRPPASALGPSPLVCSGVPVRPAPCALYPAPSPLVCSGVPIRPPAADDGWADVPDGRGLMAEPGVAGLGGSCSLTVRGDEPVPGLDPGPVPCTLDDSTEAVGGRGRALICDTGRSAEGGAECAGEWGRAPCWLDGGRACGGLGPCTLYPVPLGGLGPRLVGRLVGGESASASSGCGSQSAE